MKKFLKILKIVMWVLLTGGLCALLGFTTIKHMEVRCPKYTIDIDYGKADMLVTKKDIYQIVKQSGHILKGQSLKFINVEKIESSIKKQPYVADADVYVDIAGDVTIQVVQRQPILRVFNLKGESFYLDGTGHLLPLNPDFSARVLIANGFIPDSFSKNDNYLLDSVHKKDSVEHNSVMNNLYALSLFLLKDEFLKLLIEEIYVDKNGDFELKPRIGNQLILLGNTENMEDKFERLKVFYKKGINQTGWNRYSIINIKYKNQVVCTKTP